MSAIMTAAGEALKARLQAEGKPLVIDTFVFAHIPNLDPTEQLTPGITVPTEQVVYTYPIPDEYRAYVNPNQVVYSALLGSDVGDWSFNWQGLVCSEYDTLIAAATFPTLEKRKYSGATGAAGNNLTRNFLLEFSGAKELTGITISADVWQLDFTIRLLGMDERERLSNFDLYGAGWFSGDGWKLERQGGQYACAPGFGYVGGIRAELAEPMPVVATFTPADVWLDVCLKPQGSDRVATVAPMVVEPDTEVPFSAAAETGLMHYRTLIAHVDAGGGITDKRQPMNGTDGASGQLADVQRLMKRKVNAGKGLNGGGPLSSDVTLSAKLDGKTVQADAGDAITVKDVAIDGNQEDLASARGIFDTLTKGSVDCNTLTEQGVYAIALSGSVNGPGFSAKLIVFNGKNSKFVNQMALATGAGTSGAIRVAYRSKNNEDVWSSWSEGILSGRIGDGLTVSNGIISVPEYSGATASTAGTSGLVPPATAGQQESFLTGGGEYKPALTKISDSVNLADSKTAASAKAVKTAYDLA
uniref:phage tail-collar fiber domain-containing protein n=1 Tax=Bilophila wadsworthia TaxID=35833 RepID=UPI003FF05F07